MSSREIPEHQQDMPKNPSKRGRKRSEGSRIVEDELLMGTSVPEIVERKILSRSRVKGIARHLADEGYQIVWGKPGRPRKPESQ